MGKRIVCLCLAASMLIPTTVFANVDKVKFSGNVCTITGTASVGESVGILVTNGGETGGDVDKAITFMSSNVTKGGTFSYSLNMSEERITAKKLSVFVKVGENERKEFVLDYVSPAELASLIQLMKNTTDSKQMQNILNNSQYLTALTALGCEMEWWNASDKENASLVFYNNKACLSKTAQEIERAFETAVLLSSFKSKLLTATQVTDQINAIQPIEISDKKWSEIKQNTTTSAKVISYLQNNSPYLSLEALCSEFGAGAIFTDLFNASAYGTIRDILNQYKSILGMESQTYYNYYYEHQDAVAKELLKLLAALNQSIIESKSQFNELMERAVNNAKANSVSTPERTGGGGGGGSAPATPIVAPVVTIPENNGSQLENNQTGIFTDLGKDHWAYNAVYTLHEKKVINGYEDGTFKPEDKVSREEFLTMLINALDIATIGGTCPFDDVEYGQWYSPYVTTAWLKGMISGIDQKRFGLGAEISREDIATILMRSASQLPAESKRAYSEFADESNISEYAKEAIKTMYEQGIVNGSDGYFNPKASATRAETAVMICNFMNMTNGGQS